MTIDFSSIKSDNIIYKLSLSEIGCIFKINE